MTRYSAQQPYQKNMYIVGDRWQQHLGALPIFSVSQLMQLSISHLPLDTCVRIGQGVCPHQLQALSKKIKSHGVAMPTITPCPAQYVHKENKANIMITEPIKEKDDYIARLCINENCAELQDHFTGQHISAMVLIEVARQMVLAVTEKYLLTASSSLRFILQTLESQFENFVFPSQAEIRLNLTTHQTMFQHNARLCANLQIIQDHQRCVSFKIHYTLLQADVIDAHEKHLCENVFYESLKQ